MNSKLLFLFACLCIVVSCNQNNPDKRFLEASTSFAEERYEEALPIYEALLAEDFKNPNLYAKMGLSYGYTGQYDKCTQFIERSFEAGVEYFELYDLGSLCYERQNKPKEALAWYEEGVKKYPDRYEFKNRAGLLAFRSDRIDQAMLWFTQVAEKNPKNVDWNYNAGTVAERLKKYDQAEMYYRRVLETENTHANASFSLGSVFEKRNQPDIAMGYYQKALKYNPDHLSALLNLAQLEQTQKPAEALVHWQQYLKLAEAQNQPQRFLDQAKKQIKLLQGGTK